MLLQVYKICTCSQLLVSLMEGCREVHRDPSMTQAEAEPHASQPIHTCGAVNCLHELKADIRQVRHRWLPQGSATLQRLML